ncbi:unnamed protein product [Owenia fusiformis]|uniref:Uncharacterized protein n=1 Tax=Owenia fusiformis TaxID=6347 RepID=A0A8J1TVV9_OWEFU|nr:unnamed protein product [Owenia fusiformis]
MTSTVVIVTGFILLCCYGNSASTQVICGYDILWVFDTSCSISAMDKILVKDFIKDVADQFDYGADPDKTLMSVMAYDKGNDHQFYFNNASTISEFDKFADEIDLKELKCRTLTWKALKGAERYFEPGFGQRNQAIDVIILVTDGVTFPRYKRPKTIKQAKWLRKKGYELFIFALQNRFGVDGGYEFTRFTSDSDGKRQFEPSEFHEMPRYVKMLTDSTCSNVPTTSKQTTEEKQTTEQQKTSEHPGTTEQQTTEKNLTTEQVQLSTAQTLSSTIPTTVTTIMLGDLPGGPIDDPSLTTDVPEVSTPGTDSLTTSVPTRPAGGEELPTIAFTTTPSRVICPNGFYNDSHKDSCRIFMSGCDGDIKRCCGCTLAFSHPGYVNSTPMWPSTVLLDSTCLCEDCLNEVCIPAYLKSQWLIERKGWAPAS